MTTRIGIFVFEGAEELDWAGPWEVLRTWAKHWPDDDVDVFTIAREPGPVTCAKGLRVLTDYTWSDALPIDVLVYPGGQGTRAHLGDESIREWVTRMAKDGTLMTSVCTGSLVYADAGLLDGRPATTYWSLLDFLGSLGHDVEVRGD